VGGGGRGGEGEKTRRGRDLSRKSMHGPSISRGNFLIWKFRKPPPFLRVRARARPRERCKFSEGRSKSDDGE